ncbi:hypothetical protein HZY86_01145 [Aerococcaceae bacterium DSM 111020]|nr:hypothetical protein [Aerococcaceae bacterium DSM 111020]
MKKILLAASMFVLCSGVPIIRAEEKEISPESEALLKEEEKQDTGLTINEKELEKVNDYLKESLEESHQFALEGDESYDLHLLINEIKFIKDGRLIIQVEPQINELSEDDKDNLINACEGMGQLALFLELEDSDALERDLFLSFRNGPEILGNSKMLGDGVKWKNK